MKKLIIIALSLSILSSCVYDERRSCDKIMSELQCPVSVVAINGGNNFGKYSSIVVVDGLGEITTFSGNDDWAFTNAIASSTKIGDTIKHCYNGK